MGSVWVTVAGEYIVSIHKLIQLGYLVIALDRFFFCKGKLKPADGTLEGVNAMGLVNRATVCFEINAILVYSGFNPPAKMPRCFGISKNSVSVMPGIDEASEKSSRVQLCMS